MGRGTTSNDRNFAGESCCLSGAGCTGGALPVKARWYICLITSLGSAAAWLLFDKESLMLLSPYQVALFFAASTLAFQFPIRLYSRGASGAIDLDTSISVFLAGAILFGPSAAFFVFLPSLILVSLLSGVPLTGLVFRASSWAIGAFLGALVFSAFGGQAYFSGGNLFTSPTNLLSLLSYVSSSLSAVALMYLLLFSFVEGKRVSCVILESFKQETNQVTLVMLLPLGIILAFLYQRFSFGTLFLFVPLMGMYLAMDSFGRVGEEVGKTVQALARALNRRDPYTSGHSERVARYASIIAREMGLPESEVRDIEEGARLHDVGKIAVRDDVLRKAGKLTEEELAHMRTHMISISEILSSFVKGKFAVSHAIEIARVHHERYDGKGYPAGLSGPQIPIGGRILAIADVYDALTTARSYKPAFPEEKAVGIVKEMSGTHLDPAVVGVFLQAYEEGRMSCITREYEAGIRSRVIQTLLVLEEQFSF